MTVKGIFLKQLREVRVKEKRKKKKVKRIESFL